MPDSSPAFQRGQLVRVRSYREIAATLDRDGKLDGMPFMPEMQAWCGSIVRIRRRALRTCVAGQGIRHLRDTVFLDDLRCDGAAHDGCQRNCLIFWKEAWLEPAPADVSPGVAAGPQAADLSSAPALLTSRNGRYVCQSTELAAATTPAGRWSLLPFLREIAAGELRVRDFLQVMWRTARRRFLRWRDPQVLVGSAGKKSKGQLGLQAGEWVRVRSRAAIEATLNEKGSNCGLGFQPSMAPAIGRQHRVAFPVHRIILEQTGAMVRMTNTVALDGVVCEGACVNHCPRAEYLYWRESWLERTDFTQQIAENHHSLVDMDQRF